MNERSFRTKVRRYAALERALQRDYSPQVKALVKLFAASDDNFQDGVLAAEPYRAAQDELRLNGFDVRVDLEGALSELEAELEASQDNGTGLIEG